MDRIFLAVIVSGLLVIVTVISLLVFYKDEQSASLLRHSPGIGLIEPKQLQPAEALTVAALSSVLLSFVPQVCEVAHTSACPNALLIAARRPGILFAFELLPAGKRAGPTERRAAL